MDNNKPLVIYHGNCQDGFTAAWAIWIKYSDWEFYPAKYGEEPPDMDGRDVYMVDFSYKRNVILEMSQLTKSIIILDHHKTAQTDLADLNDEMLNIKVIFNMDKSGARLAWNYFHPNEPLPSIIKHVEDRDLWKFLYPYTKEISAALFSYPYDFETWTILAKDLDFDEDGLISEGSAILRNHQKFTEELATNKFKINIGGHNIWCVNVPYNYSSDMGHLLSKGEPFAATVYYDKEGFVYSLRSDNDGLDVSEIAKLYGGGGHKHAAGFKVIKEFNG